jgi:ferredoxin-thioredoxin reductase catalytic subunit
LITYEHVRKRAESDAKTRGYVLNPNQKFLNALIEGLIRNEERYGYPSCPCRLASGIVDYDRDIICPCDYRDPDVEEFGVCYCALYVRADNLKGDIQMQQVPERRPLNKQKRVYNITVGEKTNTSTSNRAFLSQEHLDIKLRMYYCKQCGYIVFREDPPYACPICKAKKNMFSEIKTFTILHGS